MPIKRTLASNLVEVAAEREALRVAQLKKTLVVEQLVEMAQQAMSPFSGAVGIVGRSKAGQAKVLGASDEPTPSQATIPWNWHSYQQWASAVVDIQLHSRFEFALLSLAHQWSDLLCFDPQTKQPDDLGKLLAQFIETLHQTNALWNAAGASWPRGAGVQMGHRKKPSAAWAAMECFNDIRQLVLDGDVTECGIYGSRPVPADICERFKQLLVQDLKGNGIPHLPADGIALADAVETDVMQEAKQLHGACDPATAKPTPVDTLKAARTDTLQGFLDDAELMARYKNWKGGKQGRTIEQFGATEGVDMSKVQQRYHTRTVQKWTITKVKARLRQIAKAASKQF
jgi:hypothetical protein